jgi:hypothetical protein
LKSWKFRLHRSPSLFRWCRRIPRILYQIRDFVRNHASDQSIRLTLYLRLNKIWITHLVDIWRNCETSSLPSKKMHQGRIFWSTWNVVFSMKIRWWKLLLFSR